jgi:5'-methylthioadenosine phosphorylase
MAQVKIGIIGGTGLYQMEGLSEVEEMELDTPFGSPSDVITTGTLEGKRVAFLPRHGRGHRISPSELPVRANIYALKSLGVEWIVAMNSAGSFKYKIEPGHLVIPDQIIDRTRSRVNTFFEGGIVAHISFAQPFCPVLSQILYQAARDVGATVHMRGTYLAMEGPPFSTRAESQLYRSWGADVIGMTLLPEAKLAREAEICYSSLACVSDYDSWHERHEPVTVDMIMDVLHRNADTAKKIIRLTVRGIPEERNCGCARALENAIITAPERIPAQLKKDLELLIGKYIH